MTDDLIARLSADVRPVRRGLMWQLLIGALVVGGIIATIAMYMMLGLREDIATAPTTMIFWTKSFYTFALAVLGFCATIVLARPDGRTRWPWIAAIGLGVLLAIGAAMQLMIMPADQTMHLIVGGSSLVCPFYIVGLSLPVLAAVMLVLRRMAPARATLAGLAAGLFAGGTGAWVYTFHCGENGMMFLTLWYTLGILVVAALGALIGRFALRW
ncbi:MAG: hypothetical protein JWP26_1729 [Devosia sp.]|uniref:DUF1109 domain-containing protein n=1 Tax=Devosia sp. TaxID=1871048 RepID=UPI0026117CBC|nr:DUF1109 domain-containing protein [Devosia sp.]MDB5586759.1 hypothetical protein [Devosia sp.]